ncbi:MAG: UvrD-helicase domain-containing protein [Mariprofundaceae bacterium]|nr:UvrD-helicase domain-containing protein [Mariprofundaceae bacterium]
MLDDQQARQQALNPQHSFLVQAPAGSGKTELLIQRVLALLNQVDRPEKILALTFTRKAAAEMRDRIIEALRAGKKEKPSEAHRQHTWQLARQVLQRDEALQWHLIEHPQCLRLMTLDAFAHTLSQQLPVLSGLGAQAQVSDDSLLLYTQAIENLLQAMLSPSENVLRKQMDILLFYMDNNMMRLQGMLGDMLARREQWLPHILDDTQQFMAQMQGHMQHLVADELSGIHVPRFLTHDLVALARFSADNTGDTLLQDLECWPEPDVSALPQWLALVDLLLTQKGTWRKTVNTTNGFPAGKVFASQKEAMRDVLAQCAADDTLLQQLKHMQQLKYLQPLDDQQYQLLDSMRGVLKRLAVELILVFKSTGQLDFSEVNLRALQAIGHENNPSDALLYLDYAIEHILVDEFQDTSRMQIHLLQQLCSGWQEDDGRTLFLVGDPMQSIYAFRKAEVGLFLEAKHGDLCLPALTFLQLQRNFRSHAAIVSWVNRSFSKVFPALENIQAGAVSYSPSEATHAQEGQVMLYTMPEQDDAHEAQQICQWVQEARAQQLKVGILGRSRAHLFPVIQALRHGGIAHRAIDLLPLADMDVVRDLHALCCVLYHPADQLSWAALLRTPWVGLELADNLSLHQDRTSFFQQTWEKLSPDGQARMQRFRNTIQPYLNLAGRVGARALVQAAWLALEAPACLAHKSELDNAERFFKLLESMDDGSYLNLDALARHLQQLYALPDTQTQAQYVDILTMHAAKGLQWDVVILAGLGKTSGRLSSELMRWVNVPVGGEEGLLMSPRAAIGRDKVPLFEWIGKLEKEKDQYELARLFYVACTRAKQRLYLSCHQDKEKMKSGSFMAMIEKKDTQFFGANLALQNESISPDVMLKRAPLMHISLPYQAPEPCAGIAAQQQAQSYDEQEHISFSWASKLARTIGIALHMLLRNIGQKGIENWQEKDSQIATTQMQHILMDEGLSTLWQQRALEQCQLALNNILSSQHAQWMLSNQHQDAQVEWPLTMLKKQQSTHFILDRSFVEKGTRWVIDYKTGQYSGHDPKAFIHAEVERYRPQLTNYAQAVAAMSDQPIRCGLYFPLLDVWREVTVFK